MVRLLKLFETYKKKRLYVDRYTLIDIDRIGTVGFRRSYKAKNLILRVKGENQILVSVPRGIHMDIAIRFVISRRDWIQSSLKKLSESKAKDPAADIPPVDRLTARRQIVERVETLARQHGFSYRRIFIKNQKTIWGSCSAVNNLNFNYRIASLPQHLMDYVIYHELVHTRIKNHSSQFWRTLDNYVGNAKALRSEIRKYQSI